MVSPMRTDIRAELETLIGEYRSMTQRLADLNETMAGRQATVRSMDGSVTVTVGAHGELMRLSIDPVLGARLDLRVLATRVLEASARAQADVGDQVRRAVVEFLPERLRPAVAPDGQLDLKHLLPDAGSLDLGARLSNGLSSGHVDGGGR
jgi:DNA-binding protein YbaB